MSEPWREWGLLHTHGTHRALMWRRLTDEKAAWQTVAQFDSYNDAEYVCRVLNEYEGRLKS